MYKKKEIDQIYSYIFQDSVYSIYAINNGLVKNYSMMRGMGIYQQSTPMFDYLLNCYSGFQGDFTKNISTFTEQTSKNQYFYNPSIKESDENAIKLPTPKAVKKNLDYLLYSRNSMLDFSDITLPLGILSDVLHYSAGVHKMENDYRYVRTYGSGGGLYPISLYLYIRNVEKLSPGFYLYQPVSHSLKFIHNKGSLNDVLVIDGEFNDKRNIKDLSVAFFYTYNVSINYFKYGELSLLLALMDVGAMIQIMHLIATYHRVCFSGWGGFRKRSTEILLYLDRIKEHIVMSSIMGMKNEVSINGRHSHSY